MSTKMAASTGETLVELLNKATNPANREDDWDAIMAFCDKINQEKDGPQLSVRLIAHKMQSPQEREALQGLNVLEACVRNCENRFHQEIGKFRFLNEMIKIVSPKYLGNLTTENVKRKCIILMFTWTKTLGSETKISEAYSMLKKQGIIIEDPVEEDIPTETPSPREDTLFKDEEKQKLLQRLLRSKNPEDHQAANRLIKNIVREEEERKEKALKRIAELEKVNNNVKLLTEMIEAYKPGGAGSDGDREIMKELHEECERLRPNLFRLASDADDKDDSIVEILKANDNLVKVLEMYQTTVISNVSGGAGAMVTLLDVGDDTKNEAPLRAPTPTSPAKTQSESILDDDLTSLGLETPLVTSSSPLAAAACSETTAKDLDEIFKSSPVSDVNAATLFQNAFPGSAPGAPATDLSSLLMKPLSSTSIPAPPNSTSLQSALETKSVLSTSNHSTPPLPSPLTSKPEPPKSDSSSAADDLVSAKTSGDSHTDVWSNFENAFAFHPPEPLKSEPKPEVKSSNVILDLTAPSSDPGVAPAVNAGGAILDATDPTPANNLLDAPLLQPMNTSSLVPSMPKDAIVKTEESVTNGQAEPIPGKALDDINLMSQGLLQNTMKELGVLRADKTSSPFSPPPKATLSQLQEQKRQEKSLMESSTTTTNIHSSPVKPPLSLANMSVSMESIKPSTLPPLTVYDQHGLKIMLFFSQSSSSPSPDVAVMIMTTMSTNTSPVKAFEFQAEANKTMPVKLEPPSATELPSFNPILPPTAISQVMLVGNPNKDTVKLKFKLSFSLGDVVYSDTGDLDGFPEEIF